MTLKKGHFCRSAIHTLHKVAKEWREEGRAADTSSTALKQASEKMLEAIRTVQSKLTPSACPRSRLANSGSALGVPTPDGTGRSRTETADGEKRMRMRLSSTKELLTTENTYFNQLGALILQVGAPDLSARPRELTLCPRPSSSTR